MTPPPRLAPQAGAHVWNAAALTPNDWMVPLGAEAAAELEAAVAALAGRVPQRAEDAPLPNLAQQLRQTAERLEHGRGFVLLRGLPLERLAAGGAEAALLALAVHLGVPLPQDGAGNLLGHVPAGAEEPPRFHADPADTVALLCLQQAKEGGRVQLLSAAALHNALLKADRAALAVLHAPFPHRVPAPEAQDAFARHDLPVFSTASGAFVARYDRDAIPEAELSPGQRAALAALDAAAAAPGQALGIPLHAGDVLLFNPHLVWKRRGGETDRLLLRLWLSAPGSRALPESFRAVYGQTAAGAPRGGAPAERMVGG